MKSADTDTSSRLELLTEFLRRLLGEEGERLAVALLPWLAWRHLAGGEVLFRAGEPAEDLYFVVSGRLRAIARPGETGSATDGEVTRGQTIGEMEFLTGERRTLGLVGMRDSTLACLSLGAWEEIAHRDPPLAIQLMRLLAERFSRRLRPAAGAGRPVNLCLLPITGGIDVLGLAHALARKLSLGRRVLVIGRDAMPDERGRPLAGGELTAEQYRQFAQWLDEVESSHDFLIFVTDAGPGEWTRRCIRESDEVLLLARADASPAPHPVEDYLDDPDLGAARRTLVLLHDGGKRMPAATCHWLAGRSVAGHIHVRPTLESDVARLARILGGNAVGLVLSGGGARGFAHLGVMKALEEAGVPIDTVGGASIGAVMGAYCAFDLPAQEVIEQARRAFAAG